MSNRYNPRRGQEVDHYVLDIHPYGSELYAAIKIYCRRTNQVHHEEGIFRELIAQVFAAINTDAYEVMYRLNEYPVWKAVDCVDEEIAGGALYTQRKILGEVFRETAIHIWERIGDYPMPSISSRSIYMPESIMLSTLILSHHENPDED